MAFNFAGIKTWFTGHKSEVTAVAEDALVLAGTSGLVSPALLAALNSLGSSFEASGIAYTCFHKAVLLENLAVALLGNGHPAVVAHLAAITADVNAVAALNAPAVAATSTVTTSSVTTTTSPASVTSSAS